MAWAAYVPDRSDFTRTGDAAMPFRTSHHQDHHEAAECGRGKGQHCRSGRGNRQDGRHRHGRQHADADIRLAILAILANQPGNGLSVMNALVAEGFCRGIVDASAVYPTLSLLTDMGMIAATAAPAGQTLYTVLDEGAAVLASNRPVIDAILADIARDGSPSEAGQGAGRRGRHCRGHRAGRPGPADAVMSA
jgi:DNA-binding PadR family transcriptional regulator